MKDKSLFAQFLAVVILAVICLLLTLGITLLAGSLNAEIFDFKNLNFANMIPVFLIGCFISCVIIGICVLFVMRTVWIKAKDFLKENNKEKDGIEK